MLWSKSCCGQQVSYQCEVLVVDEKLLGFDLLLGFDAIKKEEYV